ncbi:hypothetical protein [Lysobacter sp. HA35]
MKGWTARWTERGAAGAPKGEDGDDAGTTVAGKVAPPLVTRDELGHLERRELAAMNLQADAAVSYEA